MEGRPTAVIEKASVSKKSVLNSNLVQLAGALALSLLSPLPFFSIAHSDMPPTMQDNVLIGVGFAILSGHYFFRRMIGFPGTRSSSYIVPIFASSFVTVTTILFFLRFDYSRQFFLTSFVACILWYFFCHYFGMRARQRRLAVIPFGTARRVDRIPNVEWMWLRDNHAELPDCDGVVVDLRANLSDEWERFIANLAIAGVPVYHVKLIEESITGRVDIEHLSENSFGSLIPGLAYIKIKQWIDTAAALIVGIALLPALALIALAVKLDSPGPAFFSQRRIGYRGVPFSVFKFRTMRHRAPGSPEQERHHAITQYCDDRVTSLGRYLRRSRIDELPQILNILRGEMSWIGPRPEATTLSEWYATEIPFYSYRHIVRPGITGWAQVNQGHVAAVEEVHDKLQYDFYYIKYFTPWLDLLIVFRTIRTMITGFGSR
jgi:lipopolysaccharide/colanic/teichoic acid biosynthesis glycosyltransferase